MQHILIITNYIIMTEEKFLEIFEDDEIKKWEGDNAYQGL